MEASTIQAAPAAAFNIAQFEASDSATVEIKSQRGDGPLTFNGQPVSIEVYGPGSEQYVRAQAEVDRANSERLMQAMRGKAPKDAAAEMRAAQLGKLVACTKAINNFPIPGGAKALYDNPRLGYIRNQVMEFMEDWANFPSGSATN